MLGDEGGGISVLRFDLDLMVGGEQVAANEVACSDGYPLLDVLDAREVSCIAFYVAIDFPKVRNEAECLLVGFLDEEGW